MWLRIILHPKFSSSFVACHKVPSGAQNSGTFICESCQGVCSTLIRFNNYANDSALLKVFGHSCATWSVDHFSRQMVERHRAVCEVNEDLSSLVDFGKKWKVQFEPTKTHAMLVSNTQDCGYFPMMSQLSFGGAHIQFEEELLLVGFVFDKKLTWRPMVSRV